MILVHLPLSSYFVFADTCLPVSSGHGFSEKRAAIRVYLDDVLTSLVSRRSKTKSD